MIATLCVAAYLGVGFGIGMYAVPDDEINESHGAIVAISLFWPIIGLGIGVATVLTLIWGKR